MKILFIGCEDVLYEAAELAGHLQNRPQKKGVAKGVLKGKPYKFSYEWDQAGQLTVWYNEGSKSDDV